LDGQFLGDVDELAAAVIAFTGQALGVFVGENRALSFQNGARNDVLRGNQFDLVALPSEFRGDDGLDFGVDLGQWRRKKASGIIHLRGLRRRRHRDLLALGLLAPTDEESPGLLREIAYRPQTAKHWVWTAVDRNI